MTRCAAVELGHTPVAPGFVPALLAAPPSTILHLHVAQPLAPELALLAARAHRLALVAHVHLDVGPSGPLGFLLPAWQRALLGPVLRRAERVVVYGRGYERLVREKYRVAEERIEVIPGGVDLAPSPSHGRPAGERVLFAGRLSRQKDVPLLVDALRLLVARGRSTQLRIAGDGEQERTIRARVRAHGLEGRVAFLGRLDRATLSSEMRRATVLALPSERESQGLVLVEAMSHGLPVVATDIPGVRDVVTHRVTGLLSAPRPEPFADALDEALGDPSLREALARRGLEVAAAHAWDRIIPRWLDLYARVDAGRRSAAGATGS